MNKKIALSEEEELARLTERFYAHVSFSPGCWMWKACCNIHGYGNIRVGYRVALAHRLSFVLHKGFIPKDSYVLHSCDVRGCVNPEHLFLGSLQDNVDDMERKGRSYHPWGELHGRAKLKDEQIRLIRDDPRGSTTVARAFGVTKHLVLLIRKRQIWKHVT